MLLKSSSADVLPYTTFRVQRPAKSDPSDASALLRAMRLIDRAQQRIGLMRLRTVEQLLRWAMQCAPSDPHVQARVLSLRASFDRIEGRADGAITHAKQAILLWKELGNAAAEIDVRIEVARILLAAGNTSEALRQGLAAMEDAEAIDDPAIRVPIVISAIRTLAYVHLNIEQFDQSIAFCERGADLARQTGNLVIEGALLDSMSCAYGTLAYHATDEGKPEHALLLLERSMELSRRAMALAHAAGHSHNEATARANLAESLVQVGRPEAALALMEASDFDVSRDPPSVASHHLDTHGSILMALGRNADAIFLFERAYRAATAIHLSMVACEHLAEACERHGDFEAALLHHRRFHALYKQSASQAAQRSARVAAVHLETRQALAIADQHRSIAADLRLSNERLTRHADDLRALSLLDSLTGLSNRRRMDKMFEEDPNGFGVVMIDVDHFKKINDGWSHLVGDAVLRQVGSLIRTCCRESDTPVRYGGDEFAILLLKSDPVTALTIAERVRAAVANFDWRSLGIGLNVSVSVGYSSAADPVTAETAFAVADRRLYEAKNGGRNCVGGDGPAACIRMG